MDFSHLDKLMRLQQCEKMKYFGIMNKKKDDEASTSIHK